MELHIDTSNNQRTIVGLDKERVEKLTGPNKSQQILTLINQILKKQKKTLADITEIEVNRGPGSFTGLRVGLSIANALGWALKIPVNGREMEKDGPVEPIYR